MPRQFSVIHDDGDLLIVNKPSGLPVMPGEGSSSTPCCDCWKVTGPPILRVRCIDWDAYLGIVDLCAPKPEPRLAQCGPARSWASGQRRHSRFGGIHRKDLPLPHRQGGLGNRGADRSADRQAGAPRLGRLWCADPQGLPSRSDYRLLRREANSNLLEVRIRTGRPHQIRIHLAAVGAPLLGDPLYVTGGRAGDFDALPGDLGYHLHAHRLNLRDPRGRLLRFEAPLPPDLA